MQTITINNKTFEKVKENTKKVLEIKERFNSAFNNNIFKCYDKPSLEKFNIFDEWEKFYNKLDNQKGFYISSFNKCTFTLVFKANGYIFYITPSHNYCVEC